jgi:tetratricopeptide (TPR) repeat protein
MEEQLSQKLTEYNITYVSILDQTILELVYNLFVNDIFPKVIPDDGILYNYIALYFKEQKDHDNMMKYYQMAIEKGIVYTMNNLGHYYKEQEDYDNMKKYYLMAIGQNNSNAMSYLGYYYQEKKDYVNMMKYLLMAFGQNNSNAMSYLGYYYQEQKDYVNMMKYLLMAIDQNNSNAMNYLGYYYQEQKDYDNMMKYYLMACKKGSRYANDTINDYLEYKNGAKYADQVKEFMNDWNKLKYKRYIDIKYVDDVDTCVVCYGENIHSVIVPKCRCTKQVSICFECYCNTRNCIICNR